MLCNLKLLIIYGANLANFRHCIVEAFVNRLRTALSANLPGIDVQYKMAPANRARISLSEENASIYRPSAVMIVFCENQDKELFIPLIERMPYVGIHGSQISLPGGKFEEIDKDLEDTARRECYEEIGLQDIDVIGKLTHLHVPVSGFLVQPYVGISKVKNPQMVQQEREVKSLLKLKLSALLDDAVIKEGTILVTETISIQSPWYDVDGHKVWGATAMILTELKEICKTIF